MTFVWHYVSRTKPRQDPEKRRIFPLYIFFLKITYLLFFGISKIIQSDNGKVFVNSIITEMKQLLGIDHRLTAPYHPEANGVAEAAVKVAKTLLLKATHDNVRHWDRYHPTVQVSINNRIMSCTNSKPDELLF